MLIQAETAMKKKAAIPATLKKLPTKCEKCARGGTASKGL